VNELKDIIPYLIGAAVLAIATKLGLKVPGMDPVPKPPPVPTPNMVDPEASVFLDWSLAVKGGKLKLDAQDVEAVKVIRATISGPEFERVG
jgi:hypothetical protein